MIALAQPGLIPYNYCMTIQQQITADLKDAMRNRETTRLETIRSIKTGFINELVAKGRTPQEQLTDDEALTVIKRLHKQRLEAAEQFSNAGRTELADKEEKEAEILATYLPAQLSDDELAKVVSDVLTEQKDADISKMGIIIGAVMKQVGNQADGKRVSAEVKKQLSS